MAAPKTPQPLDLIDVREVATLTTLSVRTIERLVATGRFPPPTRLGRKRLWPREKLHAWIAGGGDTRRMP